MPFRSQYDELVAFTLFLMRKGLRAEGIGNSAHTEISDYTEISGSKANIRGSFEKSTFPIQAGLFLRDVSEFFDPFAPRMFSPSGVGCGFPQREPANIRRRPTCPAPAAAQLEASRFFMTTAS